jgi:hypothetical protein
MDCVKDKKRNPSYIWSTFKEYSLIWEHDNSDLSFGHSPLVNPKGSKYVKNKKFEELFSLSATNPTKPTAIYIYLYSNKNDWGHANMLFVNHARKEIERFESNHPKSVFYPIDASLRTVAKQFGYTYISPSDYITGHNVQTRDGNSHYTENNGYDPGGWCLAWSFWYLDFRLSNPIQYILPEQQTVSFLKMGMQKIQKQMDLYYINAKEMIRNFGFNILVRRDKILEQNGTNIYELTNRNTDHYISRKTFRNIAQDIVSFYYGDF